MHSSQNIEYNALVQTQGNDHATINQIRAVEQALNFKLSEEYAQFLLRHNGGKCQGLACSISHPVRGQISILLEKFLSASASDVDSDLVRSYRYYVDSERIPAWFLPIAVDVGANMLGIGVNPAVEGRIYFWDHEREFLDDNGVFEVALSFDQWLRNIHEFR